MKNRDDILKGIEEDDWMMKVLRSAEKLQLPDWWVCAGFVRSKVWDHLHDYTKRTPLGDIDVIYYDENNLDEELEKNYEHQLSGLMPGLPWSVKNQARMHKVNDLPPYQSSVDAISQFPETATALGVKLDGQGKLELAAPHGLEGLIGMKVCPTPAFKKDERLMTVYRQRLESKNWMKKWPKVEVITAKEQA
ncbi:nucleotidyltransferase family protein [Planococcus salinarum]|uniref:nucleotidyltransferase family protein n=1 Tax=Planococcus salinarum TaxID=622695 RepID=UPI000E3C7C53|nr:nucleotidyltransferase family protein [Planococcus salinarum]TAA72377.1 nucleotidyltransferase family protein [Planococcus salinarum]